MNNLQKMKITIKNKRTFFALIAWSLGIFSVQAMNRREADAIACKRFEHAYNNYKQSILPNLAENDLVLNGRKSYKKRIRKNAFFNTSCRVATAGGYLTGGVFLALTGYKMHQHSPQPTNLGTILILGGAGCIGESFRNLWKAWAIRTQLKNDLDSIHDCKVAIQSQTFRVSNYVWEDPASSQNVPSASMDSNQQSDQGSSSASCPPIERIDE